MEPITKKSNQATEKVHRFRRCPIGKHFIKAHLEHIPPSKTHPDGTTITRSEHCANNPSQNICAGIRWLFQKKKLAKIRLGREPTWIEAIIEYKSYWKKINAKKPVEAMNNLHEYYEILQGQ